MGKTRDTLRGYGLKDVKNAPISDKAKRILIMRANLDGNGFKTLEEVGREFGVTRERIRLVEKDSEAVVLRHKLETTRTYSPTVEQLIAALEKLREMHGDEAVAVFDQEDQMHDGVITMVGYDSACGAPYIKIGI